jgi:anti-sigma B factor antagonist
MRTETIGATLLVTDVPTLTSDNSRAFKDLVRGKLAPGQTVVEVDLGGARSVDSNGLGALISVHKMLCGRGGRMRLMHPSPLIGEMFQLLQLDKIFDIVPRPS